MIPTSPALPVPNPADLERQIRGINQSMTGYRWEQSTPEQRFTAAATALRATLIEQMMATTARHEAAAAKSLCYVSIEFLLGRLFTNNLINLGLRDAFEAGLARLGLDLSAVSGAEPDPSLGNGGLGRLAACFLDSLATHDLPALGYGINYEFGLFRQTFERGYQRELPDPWWHDYSPWGIVHRNEACPVQLYGRVEERRASDGRRVPTWVGWDVMYGVPTDIPIVGYGGRTVNALRLFAARASDEFDIQLFNDGDYIQAVKRKIETETVTKVLYPSDIVASGRELRLQQEYFLVACTARDIFRRHLAAGRRWDDFPTHFAIQLNDTHPALMVAELMRLFVDEQDLPWDEAWELTVASLGYTNHTLMPEALETWSVDLLGRVLPRHLQIIFDINQRLIDRIQHRWPGDVDRVRRMSLVNEHNGRAVRMAHLAIVGSHSVNGVAALHSELVKTRLVPDFFELWPERFNNKTNGVTPRRWLLAANPPLATLLNDTVGDGWVTKLSKLRAFEPFADDAGVRQRLRDIKLANKQRLAQTIRRTVGLDIDPTAMFDVQAKRIHEYKRQLLNALHVIAQYLEVVEDGRDLPVPKVYVFAGKAAPRYTQAKLIIKLINSIGQTIARDPRVRGQLAVAFVPDYRVTVAERIIPAADLSEQISTAGTEASGTGNMKFAMNGALTIGTLDGANIEILEEVGPENLFIFGLTAEEVASHLAGGTYDPWSVYESDRTIRRVVETLGSDLFCPDEPGLFRPLRDSLLSRGERYFHLADFGGYAEAHRRASDAYLDQDEWSRRCALTISRMGRFSSDRTIAEYARDIWGISRV